MSDLSGASILIVGATGGLGREFARQLAEAGAHLTVTGRSMLTLDDLDVTATRVPADLTDPASARQLVAAAVTAHGRLDGVINAAGVVAFGALTEMTDAALDELWTVNALAPIRMLRAATPSLQQSAAEGRAPFILTLSGVVSENPTVGIGAYSAVKAAVAAAHQVAARELRRSGIRVIDARPGHTETDLSRHPIAGESPKFPAGYEPSSVVRRIVDALRNDEKDLPSSAFAAMPAAPSELVDAAPRATADDAHPAIKMAAGMPLQVSTPASGQHE
jgi:NAD(P)-dependent dehydrogenase (short-subunit alcohol dehydrogenase family)